MGFEKFISNLSKDKEKLILILSIFLLIIICISGYFIIFKKDNVTIHNDNITSEKYILADNILGFNYNGDINLYNLKKGEILDSIHLENDVLVDVSDNLNELYVLNKNNKELNIIYVKSNKIEKETLNLGINFSLDDYESFDYDNKKISLLNKNKKQFKVNVDNLNTFKDVSISTGDTIDNYKIVDDNLIFTSGEYIYSFNLLSDNKIKNIKLANKNLRVRSTQNENSNMIAEIPVGEKIEILKEISSEWCLVKYKDIQGYITNSPSNFEELSQDLVSIHIGEDSNYIHEVGDKLFIHNNFGKDRGLSILLDINPNNLYINNLHKYSVPTKTFITNSSDTRIYCNEISVSDEGIRQNLRYSYIDDFISNGGYVIESDNIIDANNSYGTLGYIYYKNDSKINVFNTKSSEIDFIINCPDDFFAPIYNKK